MLSLLLNWNKNCFLKYLISLVLFVCLREIDRLLLMLIVLPLFHYVMEVGVVCDDGDGICLFLKFLL